MKNFKRLLSIMLVLALVISLAACNSSKDEEPVSMDLSEDAETDTKETDTEEADTEEANTEEADTEEADTEEADTTEDVVEANSVEEAVRAAFSNLPDHIYKIGQSDFLNKVAAGDDMVIIDIRSAGDYATSHVKGAINLPWGGTAISDGLKSISQDKEVFIYCVSGQTAGQTVLVMNAAGINARSVNLGYKFGISKVEGFDELITETEVNEFGSETYDIDPEFQTVADAYYAGLAGVKDTTYANYKISEDNLKAMIDNGDDFFLLSARKAKDYTEVHIEGAINIPYGSTMLDNLANVPMDKPVVVYCYSGQTAGQAVAAMRLLGYDAVSLNGGMGVGSNVPIGWANKELPVVNQAVIESGVMDYFANKPDHNYKIGQQDFVDKVVAGDDMVIIDIRSAGDYATSHVKGAINLPWGGTAISDGLKSIPLDKDVMIYCVSGQTAGQTVVIMNLAGINAKSVNLGFKFGISKVEGIDAVLETEENTFGSETHPIDLSIQAAADVYFAGLAGVKDTTFANYKVSEDNLEAMMNDNEEFSLLSIRAADAFAEGHIEGATNVPWGTDMMTGILDTVSKDGKVVVYCYSGQTAGQATAAMKLLGYDVVSLNGGMGVGSNAPIGWINKDKAVVQ